MDDPADVSSQNGSGRHLLDEGFSTRNRKVVGSNPTSGSKTAGQRLCMVITWLALLALLSIPSCVTGLGKAASLRYVGVRLAD
jgi:hypothetical protein